MCHQLCRIEGLIDDISVPSIHWSRILFYEAKLFLSLTSSFVLTFVSPFIDLFLSTIAGVKNGVDPVIMQQITQWVGRNPPPATIMIISGNKDLYQFLLDWKQIGYTILGAARKVREIAWM